MYRFGIEVVRKKVRNDSYQGVIFSLYISKEGDLILEANGHKILDIDFRTGIIDTSMIAVDGGSQNAGKINGNYLSEEYS